MAQTIHNTLRPGDRDWMVQTVHNTLRPGEPGWFRLSTLHSDQERAWMIQTIHNTLRPGDRDWMVQTVHNTLRPGESLDGSDCPPYTQTRREPG